MASQIEVAILAASQLNMDTYNWTFARGKSRAGEPMYGFEVWAAENGITTEFDAPLVRVEDDNPLRCIQKGVREIERQWAEKSQSR